MHSDHTDHRYRAQKLVLAAGFVAFALAVAAAYRAPATGYELSIYEATPTTYWAGVAVAVLAALWVAVTTTDRVRDGAHVLATIAVLSVVALPAIRGYFFYGSGDALTHLGWAREIASGTLSPAENLYPGIHLAGIMFHELAGIELTRAILLLPTVVFPLLFVVFATLCVSFVSGRAWAATVGLFSALLFVPINGISVHTVPHPSSQTILVLPFVLYLLFRYLYGSGDGSGLLSASGIALAIAGIAVVFYHPQEAMSLVAMLVAISLLQLVYRRFGSRHEIASHRPVYAHTAAIGAVFLAWTFQHERARNRLQFALESLVGGSGEVLDETGTRAASLEAIGGSVEEMFLKLFGVALLFGLLAVLRVLWNVRGPTELTERAKAPLVTYLAVGLVPVVGIFLLVFLADQGDHYFRVLGFIMVSVTLLGAVALSEWAEWLGGRFGGWHAVAVLCLVFAIAIPVQAAALHHSPYMFQSNQQVTEGAVEGHTNAFEYREDGTVVMSFRQGPRRYVDAVHGSTTARTSLNFPGTGLPGEVFTTNVTSAYDDDRYLTLVTANREREVGLYDGFRYGEEGFRTLETDSAVNRVQSNGEFDLYRIDGASG